MLQDTELPAVHITYPVEEAGRSTALNCLS